MNNNSKPNHANILSTNKVKLYIEKGNSNLNISQNLILEFISARFNLFQYLNFGSGEKQEIYILTHRPLVTKGEGYRLGCNVRYLCSNFLG